MRIPVITSDSGLGAFLNRCLVETKIKGNELNSGGISDFFRPVPITTRTEALEYITYQMPPLMLMDFSDPEIDAFHLLETICSDPWLNNGSIIATYKDYSMRERLDSIPNANVIITLSREELSAFLPKVLEILQENRQIVFQRSMQSALLASLSGRYRLGLDLMLVPCYANLIANYLFNMGFVDLGVRQNVSLVLTEMLTNAIEHGNCEITKEEKTAALELYSTIQPLIEQRRKNPDISHRTVIFEYSIAREGSLFTITDQGKGFKWEEYLDANREIDFLSRHGRGILMTRQVVDHIEFNDLGNQVRLKMSHPRENLTFLPNAIKGNEMIECQPGEIIFKEGEESDFLYYVAEGSFDIVIGGQKIDTLNPEDILMGEMSFLLEAKRTSDVIARTHGKLLKISKQDFIDIVKNHPYYGVFLARLMAQRLYRIRHHSPA